MTRILMVCLGNICRSPLAHGILESKLPLDQFIVDSAGTGNYHIGYQPDERATRIAKLNGIDISKQKCRQFKISDFDNFDLIYVMDDSNFSYVVKLARNPHDIAKVSKILNKKFTELQDVPDPYYGDDTDFQNVFSILNAACDFVAIDLRNIKKHD